MQEDDAEELLLTLFLNAKASRKGTTLGQALPTPVQRWEQLMLTTTQILSQLSMLSLVLIRSKRGDPSLCPNTGLAAATLLLPLSVCMSSCIRLTLKISNTELPSSSNSSFLYSMRAAEIITYQSQNYFCDCSLLSLLQIFCLLICLILVCLLLLWGF